MRYTLQSTQTFNRWLNGLKDRTVKNQLLARLARAESGHFGDFKPSDADLFVLRCFFDGSIRVYHTIRHEQIVLLPAGGYKSSLDRDIEKAKVSLIALEI